MNDINSEKIFEAYTLAELAYQNHFQESIQDEELLYPEGWYAVKNYKKKIEIITEAIKNNTLISDTLGYKDLVKCIKMQLVKTYPKHNID